MTNLKPCPFCGGSNYQPHHLTTIIKWFQELPLAARKGLSLANLHDLSKRLGGKHDASQNPGTISPSINCQNDTYWHGFIVNGEVRNPKTST